VQKIKALYDDRLLVLFFLANFHEYVERKVMLLDISASERLKCLFYLLSLEFRVL